MKERSFPDSLICRCQIGLGGMDWMGLLLDRRGSLSICGKGFSGVSLAISLCLEMC